jgi:hypothetical protein
MQRILPFVEIRLRPCSLKSSVGRRPQHGQSSLPKIATGYPWDHPSRRVPEKGYLASAV